MIEVCARCAVVSLVLLLLPPSAASLDTLIVANKEAASAWLAGAGPDGMAYSRIED